MGDLAGGIWFAIERVGVNRLLGRQIGKICCIFALCWVLASHSVAFANISVYLETPYSLGQRRTGVQPGEAFHALVSIENTGPEAQQVPLEIHLPIGIALSGRHEAWSAVNTEAGQTLTRAVNLTAGYGQWFDLLHVKASNELPTGNYPVRARAESTQKTVLLAVDTQLAETGSKPPVLERVVLPLDRAGKRDDKQGENTLVLRDRSLDYYKNVLRGKGASNLEIEAVHSAHAYGAGFC